MRNILQISNENEDLKRLFQVDIAEKLSMLIYIMASMMSNRIFAIRQFVKKKAYRELASVPLLKRFIFMHKNQNRSLYVQINF